MRLPSFEDLKSKPAGEHRSYALHMHPEPRFYKCRWWVFWRESACEGQAFLAAEHAICTADAMKLTEQLQSAGESYFLYNRQTPRDQLGVTPFDPNSTKWRTTKFAIALDDDPDPDWQGHR